MAFTVCNNSLDMCELMTAGGSRSLTRSLIRSLIRSPPPAATVGPDH